MKLVVPFVHSPEGSAAVEVAADEAIRRGAEVVLVGHVRAGDDSAIRVEQTRALLSEAQERLRGASVECDARWSVGAQPFAEVVLTVMEQEAADLVVLGIRRRTAVGKAVMGSYQQTVLLRAECPVLAVKAPIE